MTARRFGTVLLTLATSVAVAASCTSDPSPQPSPTTSSTPSPTELLSPPRTTRPVADLSFSLAGDEQRVQDPALHVLHVNPGSYALLVIPRLRPDRCLASVQLHLFWSAGRGDPDEIAAYPAIEDARSLEKGDGVGAYTLADNQPRGNPVVVPRDGPGWMVFDITDLYSVWFRQSALLVEIRPKVLGTGGLNEFVSLEGDEARRPRVQWRLASSC